MTGLNKTGRPTPSDYNLGRGACYFGAPLDSSTGLPTNFRHLGNCTEFQVSMETETLEHQSSREGLKTTDKEVTLSQKMTLSITLDEINFQNLALFLSGESAELLAASENPTVGGFRYTVGAAFEGGRWYDLIDNDAAGAGSGSGKSGYDLLTASPISFSSGSYTEGTHYELDRVMGRIFVIAGSTLDGATASINVALNASASNLEVVRALTSTSLSGALHFRSENPANNDAVQLFKFHKVTLKAEGDASLIGNEFTTLTLTGVAEKNEAADSLSPTLTIITHANA